MSISIDHSACRAKFPALSLGVSEDFFRSVGLVLLFTTLAIGEEDFHKPAGKKLVDYAALIERVANRVNKAPEMVNRLGLGTFPVFFEGYDYGEQLRVQGAIQELTTNSGNELWPYLIEHLRDERYALTYSRGPEDDFAHSLTVGSVCRIIAEQSVDWPCERYKPRGVPKGAQRSTHSFPRKRGRGMHADEFAAWAKEQQGKSLCELQIEQCKFVMNNVEHLRGFSAEQEEKYIGRLREQVAELENTGTPIVTGQFARIIRPLYAARIEKYSSTYGAAARTQLRDRQAQQKKIEESSNENGN